MRIKGCNIELLSPDEVSAEAVAEYYLQNREFLREYEPQRQDFFYTAEYQEAVLEKEKRDIENKTACHFYIVLAGTDDVIGIIRLSNIVYGAFCSAHLGYKLDMHHINRGYMTEAVSAITDYGFNNLGLHRIEGNVMPKNLRSLRVLEKCGFYNEGLAYKYLKINGVWEDHIHMVKLNERT